MSHPAKPLLLLLVLCISSVFAQYPIVEIAKQGVRIDKLPGAELLNPSKLKESVSFSIVPATIRSSLSNGSLLYQFNAPVYKVDDQDKVYLFGPTIRMRRGGKNTIKFTNKLFNPTSNSELQFDIGVTNFHTHGLHDSPGQLYQTKEAAVYTGGDNIFVHINPNETIDLENHIEPDHLPGLHWYHPHKHGSTSTQAFTSNGLILVEDDPIWLPDANGCSAVRTALASAPDVILHVELLTFGPKQNGNNDANYTALSQEGNSTLCCGSGVEALGLGKEADIAFINGGYQPIIPVTSGKWQRWRLIHTGYKRYFALQIIDLATNAPTDACQLQLLAKDGIYVLQIPRPIDFVFLTAGSRSEVLVKCTGPAGKSYALSSGHLPLPIGGGNTPPSGSLLLTQEVIATVLIEKDTTGASDPELKARSCTPLRPSYAADLRAAPKDKLFLDLNATFTLSPTGCTIGGRKFSFPDEYPLQLPMGKVVEWQTHDLAFHPMHIHVNPMQLVNLPQDGLINGTFYSNYFEEGDFHDTINLPMLDPGTGAPNETTPYATIRLQPGPYGGYAVAHCHFLQHEDAGCMRVARFFCQDKDPQPVDCTGKFEYPVPGTFPYKTSTPSTPGACTYDGTFQLIPQGRDSCFEGSTNEYVVYYGGGSDQCASKKVFLRQAGKFQAPRSQWGLSEAESGTNTTILSVGRNCTDDELTGLSSSAAASDVSVFLAGTNTRWTIAPVGEDCSLVNIIDKGRVASGAAGYLSSSTDCSDDALSVASKDLGAGNQRWKVKKLA